MDAKVPSLLPGCLLRVDRMTRRPQLLPDGTWNAVVLLQWFRAGWDTDEIARAIGESESLVHRLISMQRETEND